MASEFDFLSLLPQASFGGIPFPWREYGVKGGLRFHPHEYPHRPGAEVEALGRKPYEITFSGDWHAGMRGWESFFPGQAIALRRLCETEQTLPLVIPDIGTLQCKAVEWPYKIDAKKRSGQSFELKFIEDASAAFVIGNLLSISMSGMTTQLAAITLAANEVGYDTDNLDTLIDAVGTLQSFDGIDDVVATALEAACLAVIAACISLEQDPFLDDPSAFLLMDAIHEIWDTTLTINADALRKATPLLTYDTPRLMTITEVALDIYRGDTTRVVELLQLNAVDNALAIPPGKLLRYYAPLRTAQAA